uniref:Fibronectin type-III domain-containing protein n=1 Tax=Mesocestoides corti TaxID=53468 RepID=A0A5K3FWS8_MESCO
MHARFPSISEFTYPVKLSCPLPPPAFPICEAFTESVVWCGWIKPITNRTVYVHFEIISANGDYLSTNRPNHTSPNDPVDIHFLENLPKGKIFQIDLQQFYEGGECKSRRASTNAKTLHMDNEMLYCKDPLKVPGRFTTTTEESTTEESTTVEYTTQTTTEITNAVITDEPPSTTSTAVVPASPSLMLAIPPPLLLVTLRQH